MTIACIDCEFRGNCPGSMKVIKTKGTNLRYVEKQGEHVWMEKRNSCRLVQAFRNFARRKGRKVNSVSEFREKICKRGQDED